MRFAILGNSGSGKTTAAHRLAARHRLAVLDLDTVAWDSDAWNAARQPVLRPEEDAAADVRRFCRSHDRWVVEGCYGWLIQAALEYRPTLLFLEPGLGACARHCRERPFEPGKFASAAEQREWLPQLLEWVAGYYDRDADPSHASHMQLFRAYPGRKRLLDAPVSVRH